jgi:proline racemase
MTIGEELTNESIIGTHFIGRAIRETTVADYPAIVPTITGSAWITGTSQHMLAPDDPFPRGFRL